MGEMGERGRGVKGNRPDPEVWTGPGPKGPVRARPAPSGRAHKCAHPGGLHAALWRQVQTLSQRVWACLALYAKRKRAPGGARVLNL